MNYLSSENNSNLQKIKLDRVATLILGEIEESPECPIDEKLMFFEK